jgi:hypothetical protein
MVDIGRIPFFVQADSAPDWLSLVILLAFVLLSVASGLFKRYSEGRRRSPAPPGQKTRPAANWRVRLEEELERVRSEVARRNAPEPQREPEEEAFEAGQDSRPALAQTSERERTDREAVLAAGAIEKDLLETSGPALEPIVLASEPQADAASVSAGHKALVDLSDPEALKRAIIQYEVLGKPPGLRGLPSEYEGGRVY